MQALQHMDGAEERGHSAYLGGGLHCLEASVGRTHASLSRAASLELATRASTWTSIQSRSPGSSRSPVHASQASAKVACAVCTRYECRVPCNSSLLAAVHDHPVPSMTSDLSSHAASECEAFSHQRPCSTTASQAHLQQLILAATSPSQCQEPMHPFLSLQSRMHSVSAASSTSSGSPTIKHHQHAEQALTEMIAQCHQGLPLPQPPREGMHAVSGEIMPCIPSVPSQWPPDAQPYQFDAPVKTRPMHALRSSRLSGWRAYEPKPGGQWRGCAGGSAAEGLMRVLQRRLSSFTDRDVFLGQFVMAGVGQRCCGGAIFRMPASVNGVCACATRPPLPVTPLPVRPLPVSRPMQWTSSMTGNTDTAVRRFTVLQALSSVLPASTYESRQHRP